MPNDQSGVKTNEVDVKTSTGRMTFAISHTGLNKPALGKQESKFYGEINNELENSL